MSVIRSIAIVGGGSSGWMTAAYLQRALGESTSVTLVEASDIPIIGVGESTNLLMHHFQSILGLDEKAMMQATNAAFKVAIRFENFNRLGSHFYHPFGRATASRTEEFRPSAQVAFEGYHVAQLRNRLPGPRSGTSRAYQIDAGLYGEYLKGHAKRWGVRHLVDTVERVETHEQRIARVHLKKSGPLEADLFVDCTGFRSTLLGGALREPFDPVTRFLLNDRAIAARVPYQDKDRELETFTNCIGLSSGWVWNIPLWSRIGTGYVYSSQFLSPSDAEAEFRSFLGARRSRDLAFNHIEIRAGRHRRAWVGNCVAIGISQGFLEPLESTGISLTQVAIFRLAAALKRGASSVERQSFNRYVGEMFDNTRDFIVAHFALTHREDTPYWSYIRNECPVPDSLIDVLNAARARSFAPIDSLASAFYTRSNWNIILSGMGVFDALRGAKPVVARRSVRTIPRTTLHASYLAKHVHDGREPRRIREEAKRHLTEHPIWAPTW